MNSSTSNFAPSSIHQRNEEPLSPVVIHFWTILDEGAAAAVISPLIYFYLFVSLERFIASEWVVLVDIAKRELYMGII